MKNVYKIMEKIAEAFFKGKFGLLIPQNLTRIKKLESGNWSIAYSKKPEGGIILLYEKLTNKLEIKYKGKKFKNFGEKIKNFIKKDVSEVTLTLLN